MRNLVASIDSDTRVLFDEPREPRNSSFAISEGWHLKKIKGKEDGCNMKWSAHIHSFPSFCLCFCCLLRDIHTRRARVSRSQRDCKLAARVIYNRLRRPNFGAESLGLDGRLGLRCIPFFRRVAFARLSKAVVGRFGFFFFLFPLMRKS